jgi:hypothetical protein
MANLTISIDDRLLRRARVRAAQEGTSVNAVLAEYLDHYAGADEQAAAISEFLELAAASDSGSGPGRRTWTREDLYDRRGLR